MLQTEPVQVEVGKEDTLGPSRAERLVLLGDRLLDELRRSERVGAFVSRPDARFDLD